jgi:titin
MRLVLIDDRIDDYNNIVRAFTPDTDFIVFHYYTDTIDDIKNRFTSRYDSVGIIQHKIESSTYKLVDSMPDSTLYDVATTDPTLSTWTAYTDFLIWLVLENNVQYVDLMTPNLWNDPNWVYVVQTIRNNVGVNLRASIDITKSYVDFILESDNVDTIGYYFTKQIVQYKHLFASIGTEYMPLPSIVPEYLTRNVSSTITYTVVDEILSTTANGIYKLYVGTGDGTIGTFISTFIPTQNTYTYVFGNVSISSPGRKTCTIQEVIPNSSFDASTSILDISNNTIIDIETNAVTDISNVSIVSAFDIGVVYDRPADISYGILRAVEDHSNNYIVRFRGLTNAQNYIVFLQSTNSVGDSLYSSTGIVRPFSIPTSPTFVSTEPLIQSISVNFEYPSFDGGNTITSYSYSINDSAYTLLSSTEIANKSFTIPALTNGNTYTIYLTAVNARGNSVPTISLPMIPFDVPDTPILSSVDSSFGSIMVRFVKPFNGGNTITTYEYSVATFSGNTTIHNPTLPIHISDYIPLQTTDVELSRFVIRNILNDFSYQVYFRAVNARGNSVPAITTYITPDFTVPDPPTIGNVVSLDSAIQVDFNSPLFNGGNTVTSYAYYLNSIDSISNTYIPLTPTEFTERSFTVNQLTNGTSYVLYIAAINARGNSDPLITFPITPSTTPDPPIILSVVSGSKSAIVSFSPPIWNGGNAITKYEYSTNYGQTYTVLDEYQMANRIFTATNLVDGNSYVIYLKAYNVKGSSAPVVSESVIPFSVPDTPTINDITSLEGSIQVSFTQPDYDGGNAITGYAYAINTPTNYQLLNESSMLSKTFLVPNLTNGESYTLYFVAINAREKSTPAIRSNIVPYTVPQPPIFRPFNSLDSGIQVFFTPPFNGGRPITDYQYSINGGNTYSPIVQTATDVINGSFSISGLENGNTYIVYLIAVNPRGNSAPAVSSPIIPYTVPDPPSISSIIPYTNSIDVWYLPPAFNGGNAVNSYSYSLDATTYTSISYDDKRYGQFTISGVSSDREYTVYLRATNFAGNSQPFVNYPVVTPDTIYQNTPGKITYTISNPQSPVTIGHVYRLYNNNRLLSTFLATAPINPYVYVFSNVVVSAAIGSQPFLIRDETAFELPIEVAQFRRIVLFGNPTVPQPHFTIALDFSNNKVRIPQLTNGISYVILLKAYNKNGNSVAYSATSSKPFTVPVSPTITTLVSGDRSIQVGFADPSFNGGNAITSYSYSINGGNTYTQLSSVDISNHLFQVSQLTNGQSYVLYLRANNARGNSVPAISSSIIPFTIPDPPQIQTVIPSIHSIQVGFSPPVTDGGNAITKYMYSLTDVEYLPLTNDDVRYKQFSVETLMPDTQYTIYMKAANARGNSLSASSYSVFTLKPLYKNIPTTLTYSVSNRNSPAVYGNTYSLYIDNGNGNTDTDLSTTFTPISGTNPTNPYVYVFANTILPNTGYTSFTIRDVTVPTAHINVTTFERFVQPTGLAINPVSFVPAMDISNNTFRILGLKNGVSYIVCVKAYNIHGNSVNYSFTSTIPFTVPLPPIINAIVPLSSSVQIQFADPSFNGGNTVVAYSFSTNGGNTYTSISATDISNHSITTGRLENGNTYVVYLKALNARGYSQPAISTPFIPFREPDAPIDVVVTPLNGMVHVVFSPPLFDGGNAITSYAYSYDYGTTSYSVDANVRSFYISNLSNGRPYNIYLKAVNARGASVPYISSTAIPSQYKNAIYRNVSGTIRHIVGNLASFANSGTQYDLYMDGNTQALSSFVPTESTPHYTFGNVTVMTVGYASFSIKYTQPISNGISSSVTVASFTEFVWYNNPYTQLTFQPASALSLNTNAIDVIGLLDGQQYIVFVKSTNARGDSIYYSFTSAVPFREPDTPTQVTVTPLNQSVQVDFLPPSFDGGNAITSYVYSYDYGTTTYSIAATTRSFLITNLSNGRPYNIYLKAVNARGASEPYISSVVVPSASNNTIYQNANGTVRYMVPNKGIRNVVGAPIISYGLYLNESNTPISIFDSTPDPHEYVFGNVVVQQIGYVTFVIKDITTPHPDTLYPEPLYSFTEFVLYSSNAQLVFSNASPSVIDPNTIVVYGLINGQQYIVFVKSTNARGDSFYYSFISAVPFREPDPPVFTTLIPLAGGIQVGFGEPAFNGGNTVTSYAYSVDGGNTYLSVNQNDIQNYSFTVNGLTNGIPYVVYLKAQNNRDYSLPQSSLPVIPFTVPDAPQFLSVIPYVNSILVDYAEPSFNGGNTITSYSYSVDGGNTYTTISRDDVRYKQFSIDGLMSGSTYSVYLRARNARGNSVPAISYPIITLSKIYRNIPTTVTYNVSSNSNLQVIVGHTYHLYDGNVLLSSFTPTVTIPPEPQTNIGVRSITRNSLPSTVVGTNPFTYVFNNVSVSTIGNLTFSIRDVTVPESTILISSFTRFVYSESESMNQLSFVRATDFSNNKFRISGLQNGTSYIVLVKAYNIHGNSINYSFSSTIPFTVPDPPQFDEIISLTGSIQVNFSDPVFNGGNTITRYDYSIDGGNTYSYTMLTDTEFYNRSFIIRGLNDGNAYSIYLRGYNARGRSLPSISGNMISFTVPSSPIITRVIPLDKSIRVLFTPSFDGGNTITAYEYSYDFGASYYVGNVTAGNTFIIPNLVNGVPYTLYLKAKNARGYSKPTVSSTVTPQPAIIITDSSFQNIYQNVKTTVYYLVNDQTTDDKLAKTGNTYALCIGNTRLSTFIPANESTFEYVFGNVIVPTFGSTFFTIQDITDTINANTNTGIEPVVLSFTKFVEYQYQQQLSFVSVPSGSVGTNNTIRIPGLIDGQQYIVFIQSTNAQGDSPYYSFIRLNPFREPDPPTIQRIIPKDRALEVSFTPPVFNGGNTITAYEYSYDFGATYRVANATTTGNSFIVSDLVNGIPYTLYLKAKNARGYSLPYVSTAVTPVNPFRVTDSSYQELYQNVQSTVHYLVNASTTNNTDTVAKFGNTYALCIGNTSLSTFTPTNGNAYEYVFGNVIVPTFGSTTFTIKDITTTANTGIGPAVLSFTQFVVYQYQQQLSFVSVPSGSVGTNNTIRIPGLIDGQQYIVFIQSTNAEGDSRYYSFIRLNPFRVPDPPIIEKVRAKDRSLEVLFTPPVFDGGNTITSYEYSYDFGANFRVANVTNGNTFIVPDLINDVPYTVYLRAKNARGYSTPYLSSAVSPAKSIVITDSSFQNIYQNVKTTVYYLMNERDNTEKLAKSGNTYALCIGNTRLSTFTPTNGTTFEYVFGNVIVTTVGNTDFTIKDITENANTNTSTSIDPTVLSFTKFVEYQYQQQLSFVSISSDSVGPNNTIRIPGLIDGQQYVVFIKSTNSLGDSPYYSFMTLRPFRVPDSPTIQLVSPMDRSVEVSFTPPAFDGGNTITAYEYSYDFGANFYVANVIHGNTFIVPGLINDVPYFIYLKAKNARGYSIPFVSSEVTPQKALNIIDDIYQNRKTTIRYILNNNVPSYLDKKAKSGNTYTLNIGGNSLSTFTPINDTFEYVFGNVTVPTFGNIAFSINDITAVNSPVNVLSFNQTVLYEYETDLSFVIVQGSLDFANTIRIPGLVDGQQYVIFIRALNAKGESEYYSFTSVTPYRIPDPPVIEYVRPNDASIDVFFTPAFDGGSPITSYSYAYTTNTTNAGQTTNNGNTLVYTPFEPRMDGLYRIPNVTNGTNYTVYIKSRNLRGSSIPSNSATTSPFSVPFTPTISRLKPTDTTITVYFTEPENGGNTITDYLYSINSTNDQDYVSMNRFPPTNAPYIIESLVNYTEYTIRVKAVNARGNSFASVPAVVKTSLVPYPPTIYELIPQVGAIDISFSVPSDGGNPIIDYVYSVNDSAYVSMNQSTNRIFRIRDLSNDVPYTVSIQAINIAGNSASSNTLTTTPFDIPDSPSIVSTDPSNKSCIVMYTPPAWNGGNTITGYKYSLNAGPFADVEIDANNPTRFAINTTPTSVYQLINGAKYDIRLFAVNARGNSFASAIQSFTPRTIPDVPSNVKIYEYNQYVTASFITEYDGGNTIVGYSYSLDGVMSEQLYTDSQFITISGLENGRTYTLGLHAKNSAGYSSYYQSINPYTTPDKPVIVSILPDDSKVSLGYIGFNGGRSTITTYSIGGGEFNTIDPNDVLYDSSTNTYRFDISRYTNGTAVTALENGTTYRLRVRTVNRAGYSPVSDEYQITPYTKPKPPAIRYITPGIQSLNVFFTPNSDNGGNTITQYEYVYVSEDGLPVQGTIQNSAVSILDPSFVISNVVYGVNYSVGIRAANYAGFSAFSSIVVGSPADVPFPPTINEIVSSDKKLTIYFTKGAPRGTNASMCTYYVYDEYGVVLDSREFQTDPTRFDASFVLVDISGSPLINGLKYYIDIQNRNSDGYSALSNRMYNIPCSPPSPPIFLTNLGVNQTATITFEPNPDNGGAELTEILVSFNGPLRSINREPIGLNVTTLQFGGLNNKAIYKLQLYAVNPAGISAPAEIDVITYQDVTSLKYIQSNSTLNPNGSSSNRLRYSTVVGINKGNTTYI